MLPPDPPPPDLPGSVTNGSKPHPRPETNSEVTRQTKPPPAGMPHAGLGGHRPLAVLRLVLLALSTIGVGLAFALLVSGHLGMAARFLAGDVLLIFAILMIA